MNDEKADRPTREAVERALKLLDGSVLAVEVRALRAEIAVHDGYTCAEMEARCKDLEGQVNDASMALSRAGHAVDTRHLGRSVRAALAARTPQPAAVVEADDNERAYIADAMRHGAGLLTKLGNKTSTSADRFNDARSGPLNRVARHYYRAADVIRAAAATYLSAPLPAVPDGEDAAVDEMEGHFIDANERMGEALVAIGMALGLPRPRVGATWGAPEILARIAEAAPRGEDVPARLDAVRQWVRDVQATDWTVLPSSAVPAFAAAVRDVARLVDEPWGVAEAALSDDAGALRAAVAAALARPTEPGHG